MVQLTRKEKEAIARAVGERPQRLKTFVSFAVYILPTVACAVYGIWRHDYIALTVAYGGLLLFSLWYLSYTSEYSKPLYSAIRKYEEQLQALEDGDSET